MTYFRMLAAAALVSLVSLASPPAEAGDGQRALSVLPRNTSLIITWNLARSRSSPIGGEFVDILADDKVIGGTVQRLRKRMKLAWERDIDTVVFAMATEVSFSGQISLLIEGRFTPQMLASAAQKERGFRGLIHRGVDYYQVGGTEVAYLDGFWVTTRRGRMPRIIDIARAQGASAKRNRALMSLLSSVPMSKDMWCAMVAPKRMREEVSRETGTWSLHGLTASVDFRRRMRVRMRAALSKRDDVVSLGTWLKTKGPNQASVKAMGLSGALRKATVSRRENSLELVLDVPEGAYATLEKHLRELAAGK
ncbi:hypothetical protein [Haliangium ochraceum]|uniref:Uncharacterized protein n=1 Tax=Haliangium ochraceum (strain DSM 14365 / JCM 11303 / SMP-2) TaxID=502025 RepID=D0LYU4_HALO1|nr:hypothetical protein [Haliangium ochraceum]ACY14414.1 hypothetical protein Hoch_1866 [Haliangium ochraceum DSM 14365]